MVVSIKSDLSGPSIKFLSLNKNNSLGKSGHPYPSYLPSGRQGGNPSQGDTVLYTSKYVIKQKIIKMAKNKTHETEVDVFDFIDSYVDNDQKKADSYKLIEFMSEWSGFGPKMWGPTIIGFGSYHYKYASGHEGDAPLLGFSPRKAQFSIYVYSKTEKSDELLIDLGKFKMGKACIYIKKLSDINISILEKLSAETITYLNEHHECACRN